MAEMTPAAMLKPGDKVFARAWREAAEIGTRALEHEAARRAYHGVSEPVFYKGEICGYVQKYSDSLMMFLLKARKPAMYRDMMEQGKGGVNISIQANVAAAALLREMMGAGAPDEGATGAEHAGAMCLPLADPSAPLGDAQLTPPGDAVPGDAPTDVEHDAARAVPRYPWGTNGHAEN